MKWSRSLALLLAAAPITHPLHAQSSNPNRAPTAAEQTEALAAIRAHALNYTRLLPDYTCTQVTNWTITTSLANMVGRERSRSGVTETQIGYLDHKEMEKLTTINGKPAAEATGRDAPPIVSHGEFGSLLARIFDPAIPVEFGWGRWEMLDGRRMYVFSYHVPKSRGFIVKEPQGNTTVAFKGLIYADVETKVVRRIEMECLDFPFTSSYRMMELKLNYKPTQVAEQEFILPSDFEENVRRSSDKAQELVRLKAQFRRYQRFTADAQLQFSDADSGKQQ
jgi:hypothetical protein